MFQDFRLLDHLTTWENVALPLRVMGKKESDYREDVTDLLRWVGLGDRIDAYPEILSGGEKQRAAIARAVIGRPELLLADEPTGNVDPMIADRLLRLFVELNRLGTSVIIATHDYGLMDQLDAPRLVLYEGHLRIRMTAVQLIADIRDYPWRNLFAGSLPARFQPQDGADRALGLDRRQRADRGDRHHVVPRLPHRRRGVHGQSIRRSLGERHLERDHRRARSGEHRRHREEDDAASRCSSPSRAGITRVKPLDRRRTAPSCSSLGSAIARPLGAAHPPPDRGRDRPLQPA